MGGGHAHLVSDELAEVLDKLLALFNVQSYAQVGAGGWAGGCRAQLWTGGGAWECLEAILGLPRHGQAHGF